MIDKAETLFVETNSSRRACGTDIRSMLLARRSRRTHFCCESWAEGFGSCDTRSSGCRRRCSSYQSWASFVSFVHHSEELFERSAINGSMTHSQSDRSTGPEVDVHSGSFGSSKLLRTFSGSLSLPSKICFWRLFIPSIIFAISCNISPCWRLDSPADEKLGSALLPPRVLPKFSSVL